MKQFRTIFCFEYLSYAKNKVFVGLTALLIAVMAVVLFYPRFTEGKSKTENAPFAGASKNIAVASAESAGIAEETAAFLQNGLAQHQFTATEADEEALKSQVSDGTYDAAIFLTGDAAYKYIVETAAMTDMTEMTVQEILTVKYQYARMAALGLSAEDAADVMQAAVTSETVILGNDQSQNFFYTYILMFLLYMAVLLYGQFVAQSVAAEKSSRAMELLITSAKPVNLMFGKVLGAGAAGFTQLVLLLGSAFVFYGVNKSYWAGNMVVESIFAMPLSMLLYTILFFVLGYLLYSFLYGALASLASRLEDINTLVMPVTFLMIASFMITVFSMINNVDNGVMKAASFIPFTSPMAMFTRIALGHVEPYEIVISVAILLVSTVLIGYLAAAIYKIGVLMYGKPPKPKELIHALRGNRSK